MIRVWYLWLRQYIRGVISKCDICGQDGIESWSIHPAGLCKSCDYIYQRALTQCGSTEKVEEFLTVYGRKEFLRLFGGYDYNPLAPLDEDDYVW